MVCHRASWTKKQTVSRSSTKCKNKVLDALIIGKTSRVREHAVTFSHVAFQDDTFEPRLYYFLRMVMDFAKSAVRYRRLSRHVRSLKSIMLHRSRTRQSAISPTRMSTFLAIEMARVASAWYGELRGRARLATAFTQLSLPIRKSFTRRNEYAKHEDRNVRQCLSRRTITRYEEQLGDSILEKYARDASLSPRCIKYTYRWRSYAFEAADHGERSDRYPEKERRMTMIIQPRSAYKRRRCTRLGSENENGHVPI